MTLTYVEWIILGVIATLAIGIIGFFLKRTMNTTDTHDKDINEIKRTYVTKDELRELRTEVRDEIKDLADDIAEIKKTCLTKDDFYRKMVDVERKQEKILDFLLKERGGCNVK